MIRPGTVEDIPRLLELAAAMHAESRFSAISMDSAKVERTLVYVIGSGCMLVAERDDMLVGGFAGIVAEYWFSTETNLTDLALFVEPTKRGGFTAVALIRAAMAWARRRGVKHIELGISTGVHPELTGALFEKLGLKRQGALYIGEL